MQFTVYGIPTCDTCKRARKHLDTKGQAYTWVDLRQTPPDKARVADWVRLMGSTRLRNTSGKSYRSLGADRDSWSEAQWIDAFARDPMLLKRPILEIGGNPSAVGFDPGVWDQLILMASAFAR